MSEFEPDGGADWAYDDNPLEKVYFVLRGEMTVTDKDGNKYIIHRTSPSPSPPNEGRGLKNERQARQDAGHHQLSRRAVSKRRKQKWST